MSFFGRLRQLWRGVDVSETYTFLTIGRRDFDEIRKLVLSIVERSHLSIRILLVAASGFFTGAYTIFSTNVITKALEYVYWSKEPDPSGHRNLGINIATLVGTCVGMVLFGYLADCFGRKRLYGVELVIVISATLGLTQASAGYRNSMNIYYWIVFWRIVLGIGVGAEYPLSALIASEWSSTKHRGFMLAAVFLMQPLAQLTAQGVGLGALKVEWSRWRLQHDETSFERTAPVVDVVWRLVIGVGAAPAILAIVGRLTIPETPRFLLEIERNASAALQSTAEVYKGPKPNEVSLPTIGSRETGQPQDLDAMASVGDQPIELSDANRTNQINTGENLQESNRAYTTSQQSRNSGEDNSPRPNETFWEWFIRSWNTIKRFLGSKHGPMLLATSACWGLLDLAYYGLGLDNPDLLKKIWSSEPEGAKSKGGPIYLQLENNFTRALRTTGPASVTGCFLILLLINRVPRVRFMVCIFIVLAVVFAILGGSLFDVYETNHHDVTVVFYAIALFLINLGPNTILFVLPAELFETRNRGTCYGIAAACGKLGAIISQLVLWAAKAKELKTPLGGVLLSLVPAMLLGALIAWIWIPEVQDPIESKSKGIREYAKLSNRSLEEIAEDPTKGQVVGVTNKMRHLLHSGG